MSDVTRSAIVVNGGVSGLTLLGVAFVVLRLLGVIHWHWILVLAPFWLPFAVMVTFAMVLLTAITVFDAIIGGSK